MIKSVTRNGRSIVLTAVLALILVYLFSIVGYIIFKDDFILNVDRIPNKTLGMDSKEKTIAITLQLLNVRSLYIYQVKLKLLFKNQIGKIYFVYYSRANRQYDERVPVRWGLSERRWWRELFIRGHGGM